MLSSLELGHWHLTELASFRLGFGARMRQRYIISGGEGDRR